MKRSDFINVLSGGISFFHFTIILLSMVSYFQFRDSFQGFFEFISLISESNFSFDPTLIDTGMFYFFLFIIFQNMFGVLLGVSLYLRFNLARLIAIFLFIISTGWLLLSLSFKCIQLAKSFIENEAVSAFSILISIFILIVIISFTFFLISKLMSESVKKEFA